MTRRTLCRTLGAHLKVGLVVAFVVGAMMLLIGSQGINCIEAAPSNLGREENHWRWDTDRIGFSYRTVETQSIQWLSRQEWKMELKPVFEVSSGFLVKEGKGLLARLERELAKDGGDLTLGQPDSMAMNKANLSQPDVSIRVSDDLALSPSLTQDLQELCVLEGWVDEKVNLPLYLECKKKCRLKMNGVKFYLARASSAGSEKSSWDFAECTRDEANLMALEIDSDSIALVDGSYIPFASRKYVPLSFRAADDKWQLIPNHRNSGVSGRPEWIESLYRSEHCCDTVWGDSAPNGQGTTLEGGFFDLRNWLLCELCDCVPQSKLETVALVLISQLSHSKYAGRLAANQDIRVYPQVRYLGVGEEEARTYVEFAYSNIAFSKVIESCKSLESKDYDAIYSSIVTDYDFASARDSPLRLVKDDGVWVPSELKDIRQSLISHRGGTAGPLDLLHTSLKCWVSTFLEKYKLAAKEAAVEDSAKRD